MSNKPEDVLSNHLPYFPDPKSDPDYNVQLFAKYEYQVHSTSNGQQHPVFKNHQRLTQIHLGAHGPNRKLMINKYAGLGKTVDAIGVAESRHRWIGQVLNTDDPAFNKTTMNKAIIVAQNKTTLDSNFKKDIMTTCTGGCYVTEAMKTKHYRTEKGLLQAQTISIKSSYELHTHVAFGNVLAGMSNEEIAKTYSFRVIVIDEVHNLKVVLRPVTDENGDMVPTEDRKDTHLQLMRLIDNTYGCVIVVLTATPIVNDIDEYPSTINFILDKEDRIDGAALIEFYRITKNEDLDVMRRDLEAFLVWRLAGRVSRMRLAKTIGKSIVRSNQDLAEENVLKISKARIWLSTMTMENKDYIDYRYLIDAYSRALAIDIQGGESSFYINAIYASLMVWPGGQFGNAAFRQYLETRPDGITFSFTELFIQDFRNSIRLSRLYLIQQLGAEIEQLRVKNATEKSPKIEAEIARKEDYMRAFQRRSEQHPGGTFDYNDDDDILIMLYAIKARYSPVIASVIEKIIGIERYDEETREYKYIVNSRTNNFSPQFSPDDMDNRECCYIYNYYKPGGIIPICLFLEFFGYKPLIVGDASYITESGALNLSRAKRYALLFSSDEKKGPKVAGASKMSNAKIRRILEVANHPANKFGHYLKVVAGTSISAQGLNFYNMRQSHLTGRAWHEAGNIQTEARVDRPAGSHQAFNDDEPVPVYRPSNGGPETRYGVAMLNGNETQKYVKVFRHVLYVKDMKLSDGGQASIGLKMYDEAARKELKISIPLEIQERVAYDLMLNLQPNEPLLQTPFLFAPSELPKGFRDYTTYNLFYARRELELIKCRVRGHFKTFFQLTVMDIIDLLEQYHWSTIIKALTEMVNDNERIVDRHGMLNYLREEKDTFFLQKQARALRKRDEQWLSYYSEHNFVNEGVTAEQLYDRIEYEEVEDALAKFKAIDKPDELKINNILGAMTNRSKGFLVETLVSRYRRLIVDQSVNRDIMALIFQAFNPEAVYFPNNGIIIHAYYLRARQDRQAGGRSAHGKLPVQSVGELRLFVLAEGVWRHSKPNEDEMYISLLNDNSARRHSGKVKDWEHYGTTTIGKGHQLFHLQNRTHVATTRSVGTAESATTNRAASPDGLEASSYNLPMLAWYLQSVRINLYVQYFIWPQQNVKGSQFFPLVMFRLAEDPTGHIVYGNLRFRPVQTASGKLQMASNVLNPEGFGPHRSTGILHYIRVYPEIIGWVFNEEIGRTDPRIFSPQDNRQFYPFIKSKKYFPVVPPPHEGTTRHTTVIDLLPNQPRELYHAVFSGEEAQSGFIMTSEYTSYFSEDSVVGKSFDELARLIINEKGVDDGVNRTPYQSSAKSMENVKIEVATRFEKVWRLTKHDFVWLIFLLFYLQGSIKNAVSVPGPQ